MAKSPPVFSCGLLRIADIPPIVTYGLSLEEASDQLDAYSQTILNSDF
jgi:hypothetical protein